VGVGDVVTELRAFAAEITFGCHDLVAPISNRRSSPALGLIDESIQSPDSNHCGSGRHWRNEPAGLYPS
jgi:hypothetical protein